MWANIGQSQIWESKEQKLLDISIDRNMTFDEYIQYNARKREGNFMHLEEYVNV